MSEPTPDYERGRILSMITGVYILKVSKHRDAVVEVSSSKDTKLLIHGRRRRESERKPSRIF